MEIKKGKTKMKVLILGSTGTLGTGVEEACKERNIDFVSLTHDDFEITDFKESEITRHNCDVLMNGVALIGINPCEEDPIRTFAINSAPVNKLAKICQENNIIFIHPSTHGVFDGRDNPYTEESKPNPLNTYSITKYASECFAKRCDKHYITRLPILFGKKKNKPIGFMDKLPIWLKEGKVLKMATDKHDSVAYNKDVANKFIDLIEEGRPSGIYHVFNEGMPSYYEFACKLRDLYGLNNEIKEALDSDFPSKGPKSLGTKLSSIKLSPMRTWDEALEEFIKKDGGH